MRTFLPLLLLHILVGSVIVPAPLHAQTVRPRTGYVPMMWRDTLCHIPTSPGSLRHRIETKITPCVDTFHPHYTYGDMMEDLAMLRFYYPDCISYTTGPLTLCGHALPVLYLGDSTARYKCMVQAAMHGREYMSSRVVMAMVEQYATDYYNGATFQGHVVRDLLRRVCFVILPMVNPDGVAISQMETGASLPVSVASWVQRMDSTGAHHSQIKSNARGVDINRNFYNGFNNPKTRFRSLRPDYNYYSGTSPCSEVESRFMLDVSRRHDYSLFLNYHTAGNVIFHGCQNAPLAVNMAALRYARIVQCHTAYPAYGASTAPPGGTWADEVETRYRRPSVTIELGTCSPVPIDEFPTLMHLNRWVWADIAIHILKEETEGK